MSHLDRYGRSGWREATDPRRLVITPRSVSRTIPVAVATWKAPSVVEVSAGALFRHGGDWAVVGVEADRSRLGTIVLSHAAGDRIVFHPSDRAADGATIRARRTG